MEVLYARCAGLDVHKEQVTACRRVAIEDKVSREVRSFSTTTSGLLALAEWLTESTSGPTSTTRSWGLEYLSDIDPASHRAKVLLSKALEGVSLWAAMIHSWIGMTVSTTFNLDGSLACSIGPRPLTRLDLRILVIRPP